MAPIKPVQTTPENLDAFIAEITPGIEHLYGAAAARAYRQNAADAIAATLANPQVLAWGEISGGSATALLFAKRESNRTTISFLHVLESHAGAEQALLEHVLEREIAPTEAVATDYVAFCPLETDAVYTRYGFECTERQLMLREQGAGTDIAAEPHEIRPVAAAEWPQLGKVLEEAYAGHAERFLFPEVHSPAAAHAFLERVRAGAFGASAPGYTLGCWEGERCVGLALGARIYPRVGFVLHLAVLPSWQGGGRGGALLEALCRQFFAHGASRVLLAVTTANPAVRLYTRAGFTPLTPVPVYHRHVRHDPRTPST